MPLENNNNPVYPKILKILMLTIDRNNYRSKDYSRISNAQASIIAQDPSCVRMTKRLNYIVVLSVAFLCNAMEQK